MAVPYRSRRVWRAAARRRRRGAAARHPPLASLTPRLAHTVTTPAPHIDPAPARRPPHPPATLTHPPPPAGTSPRGAHGGRRSAVVRGRVRPPCKPWLGGRAAPGSKAPPPRARWRWVPATPLAPWRRVSLGMTHVACRRPPTRPPTSQPPMSHPRSAAARSARARPHSTHAPPPAPPAPSRAHPRRPLRNTATQPRPCLLSAGCARRAVQARAGARRAARRAQPATGQLEGGCVGGRGWVGA